MIVIGIDPGASGAIAVLTDSPCFHRLSETEADSANFILGVMRMNPVIHAFIERVHSMPKQGVASSFKFGQSYGFLRGLLVGLKIPFDEVTPQKWQKEMGCLTKGDKNVSKRKAQQLFPREKIFHWNADAVLIAEYGRRTLNHRNGQ